MRCRLIAIAFVSCFILAGCGVRGSLKTPPPLWGDKTDKTVQVPVSDTDEETLDQTVEEDTSTEPADIVQDRDESYLEGPY